MSREQLEQMLRQRGMSAENIQQALERRFGQGGGQQGTGRGQPATGRGQQGTGRGQPATGRGQRGTGRSQRGRFNFRGRGQRPGDYLVEIVIGDEEDGGQVIQRVFKIEAYEGYSAGTRRFGGDNENQEHDQEQEAGASRVK